MKNEKVRIHTHALLCKTSDQKLGFLNLKILERILRKSKEKINKLINKNMYQFFH